MKFIEGLLSEQDGHSMMRVMSLLSLFIGAGIGMYGVYRGTDMTGVAAICGVFVVSAFGGKVLQKGME